LLTPKIRGAICIHCAPVTALVGVGYPSGMSRLAVLLAVVALAVSCSTPKVRRPRQPDAPEAVTPSTEQMEKDILAQTTATAAAELSCPIEELIARCTAYDALGGCTAINVRGCDKTLEYQFGE